MVVIDHITKKPTTPEFVLAVFVEQHRLGFADHSISLSFEMTIEEWRNASFLEDSLKLRQGLNKFWELDCSDSEWNNVLEPANVKTLLDVCTFIADRTTIPEISPADIAGQNCMAAGAFFAICSRLRDAGVVTDEISPSTPLAKYTGRHCEVFYKLITKIAPNALSKVKTLDPRLDISIAGGLISLLLGTISVFLSYYWVAGSFLILNVIFIIIMQILAKKPPQSVKFGELKTFGDMARLIASHSSGSN